MGRIRALTGVQRIERLVLSEQVAKIITDGLLEGRFQPGERLVENELAELLGVSRSPIREALTELANSGLVDRRPGRGASIRQWTVKDLEDLFSIRTLLEGEVLRLVFQALPALDISPLDDFVPEMEKAAADQDYSRMIELDVNFHRTLWALAGNKLLEQVLQGLSLQFRLFLTLNWKFHGGIDKVADNHRRIIAALRKGPEDRVRRAMADHVVVENMIKALRVHAAQQQASSKV